MGRWTAEISPIPLNAPDASRSSSVRRRLPSFASHAVRYARRSGEIEAKAMKRSGWRRAASAIDALSLLRPQKMTARCTA